jgi:hypothetical protein
MITRNFSQGYKAGCAGAPPPLHIVDDNAQSNWYPVGRETYLPHPGGPQLVTIPIVAPFGDDPTDPSQQTEFRYQTAGMVGRLNAPPQVAINAKGGRK